METLIKQNKFRSRTIQKILFLAGVTALLLCAGCSRFPGSLGTENPESSAGSDSSVPAETPSGMPGQEVPGAKAAGKKTGKSTSPARDSRPSSASDTTTSAKDASQTPFPESDGHKPDLSAPKERELEDRLQAMTLEEKAAQLFIISPESLVEITGSVTADGDLTRKAFHDIPVGGFIYLGSNLKSAGQVKTMLSDIQAISMERLNLPVFLSVDEEGGSVARIGGSGRFDVPVIDSMSKIGQSGDKDLAYRTGTQIGAYLSGLGFNLDFAPIADVLSNPDNTVVKDRSFGSDPDNVSALALAVADGLHDQGILSVYKHFPGHGATAGDTHDGYAYTEKTLQELQSCELIPFRDGIRAGIPFIMVGHFSLPRITGDHLPASLSPAVITGLLREEMGYDGIVITDALNMEAIARQYSSAEAAILALNAGNDILLMPADFKEAYQGVLDAVSRGELTAERIDESVKRILRVKLAE